MNIQDTANGSNLTPLHLSVRTQEHTIVRNHRIHKTWGPEERDGGMPLHPGQHFRMTIDASPTGFVISVNGVHFTNFNYRVGLESAQFLFIHGDVQIFNIVMANHLNMPPIAICPPCHPTNPMQPIHPIGHIVPVHPIAPVHPTHPYHHSHHGHHGNY